MSEPDSTGIEEAVIASMEQSAEVYGLSRSAGRVYGVLYFADEPLSISELVEETGYAKSTISNVTRRLDRIGLVHRRSSEGGGRRVEFEPELELWFVIQDVLGTYLNREISGSLRSLDRALGRLDAADGEAAGGFDEARIERLRDSYRELEGLLQLAMRHTPAELIEAIERYEDES